MGSLANQSVYGLPHIYMYIPLTWPVVPHSFIIVWQTNHHMNTCTCHIHITLVVRTHKMMVTPPSTPPVVSNYNICLSYPQDGRTALHLAGRACQTAVVQFLLDNGADVHAMDEVGWCGVFQVVYNIMYIVDCTCWTHAFVSVLRAPYSAIQYSSSRLFSIWPVRMVIMRLCSCCWRGEQIRH